MLITESGSRFEDLEKMTIDDLLTGISREDNSVAGKVALAIPSISLLVAAIILRMKNGGRLFYIGAGTSGRLGVLDASECPPTFGVSADLVIGIIAGGEPAIRKAIEFSEDDIGKAAEDLRSHGYNEWDSVIGIAASGTTPYVIGGVRSARSAGLLTGCIVCNPDSPLSLEAEYKIEVVTGPEFITGSTRMKAGTAQKMVLNMISTAVMIGLGRVKGNKMIDMQLNNKKLMDRGLHIVMNELKVDGATAAALINSSGSIRKAIEAGLGEVPRDPGNPNKKDADE